MYLLNKIKTKWWIEILALAFISALIYLVSINQFSYYRDDWYYAYDGYIAGPSIFKIMFSSDRPARGLFFGIYYFLFGPQPLAYHIGAYIWRLLGAYCALWLFHLLWPRQRVANFSMALLFLTYPGFLWWPQGIEYQPMIASLCLHTFSIALTLAAIQSMQKTTQIFLWTGSVITGLSAIALVDYAIGMEAFRIFCIFLLVAKRDLSFSRKILQTIRASLIPLTIPLLFLTWKIFFFTGDRKATDISFQISDLLRAPLETTLLWSERLFTSALNVSAFAWWTPLKQYYSFLQQNDLRLGFLIATISITLTVIATRLITAPQPETQTREAPNSDNFSLNAIWLGLAGVIFGLLPVIMANRFVIFKAYSHYALPASLAAVILVVGLIHSLTPKKQLQLFLVSLLVGSAALTHRGLAVKVTNEQATVRKFWWQVYWRIPKIQEGTTLAVQYPSIDYEDDTDIVWGPANFLYYPQPQPGIDEVKYKLAGTRLDEEGIQNVIGEDAKISKPYRSHFMFLNYRRVLVMSQSSAASCVHVIDARWPELSQFDTPQTASMFPHSKIEYALTTDESTSTPLNFAFGIEPVHTWCFYYQKAELARQQSEWETIAALEAESATLKLSPSDLIEWTPFLQAYAYLGQTEKVEELAAHFKNDPFHKQQLCENLNRMKKNGYPLQPDMQATVDALFCK